jgi:hypothetical protein
MLHEIMTDSDERIEEEATSLERTIDSMSSNACFHPIHYHSFREVSFVLPLRNCAGCGQRLQPGVFRSCPVVQCVACKQFAHRSCGFSTDMAWKEVCPVNSKIASREVTTEHVEVHSEYEPKLDDSSEGNSEKEAAQPPEEEQLHDIDHHNISLIPGPETASKNAFAFLNPLLRFREAKVEESSDISSSKLEQETLETEKLSNMLTGIFRRQMKTEESSDTSSAKQEQETLEAEKSYSLLPRIFRLIPAPTTTVDAPEKHHVPPANIFRVPSTDSGDGKKVVKSTKATFPFLSAVKLLPSYSEDPSIDGASTKVSSAALTEDMDSKFNWTANGPPVHFAVDAPMDKDKANVTESTEQQRMADKSLDLNIDAQIQTDDAIPLPILENPTEDGESNSEAAGENSPLHFARHPFMIVSRALQDNIIATFRPVVGRLLTPDDAMKTNVDDSESSDAASIDSEKDEASPQSTGLAKEEPKTMPTRTIDSTRTSVDSKAPSEAEVEGLLDETPSKDAVERAATRRRFGLATVAGGIAGGMAGLVFAGPVGGVIGAKCGQTAGILGVILEGSVSIGVLASGIAAGKYTGQQLQDKLEERRVLALGHGTHRRVLLVRPTVQIDPAWRDIYAEARRTHDDKYAGLSISNILPNGEKQAKRERYEREFDIVKTDEDEIPTGDKVLLLVSRILNDKASLPGHVHRHLLTVFRERCEERGPLTRIARNDTSVEDEEDNEGKEQAPVFVLNPYRARRQDAHAVIKYVTASLLEVRPGFAASPSFTELTASAVESLVFGEVYDLVIEEIEAEYEEQDDELLRKIAEFDRHQPKSLDQEEGEDCREFISESAFEALHQLPQAHSAVDKLRYCVTFLECISDHFSSYSSKSMGADSLLKMVCQHILVAKVFAMNAQIAFLEEFARDEQLLRGREGYALVTLQASLHFLNHSQDFEKDIFSQHDDDDDDDDD